MFNIFFPLGRPPYDPSAVLTTANPKRNVLNQRICNQHALSNATNSYYKIVGLWQTNASTLIDFLRHPQFTPSPARISVSLSSPKSIVNSWINQAFPTFNFQLSIINSQLIKHYEIQEHII